MNLPLSYGTRKFTAKPIPTLPAPEHVNPALPVMFESDAGHWVRLRRACFDCAPLRYRNPFTD